LMHHAPFAISAIGDVIRITTPQAQHGASMADGGRWSRISQQGHAMASDQPSTLSAMRPNGGSLGVGHGMDCVPRFGISSQTLDNPKKPRHHGSIKQLGLVHEVMR